jgi:hypothetical protein
LSNEGSEWIEITHPFHPRRGQRFYILKIRHVAGRDIFSLKDTEHGTLTIPRDWTNKADPDIYGGLIFPAPIHSRKRLLDLFNLIEQLQKKSEGD